MREEDDEDEHVVEVRLLGVENKHLIVVEKLVIEDRILAGVVRKLEGDAHKLVGVAHKPEDDAHKLVEGDRKLVEVEVQDELDLDHPSHADARDRVFKLQTPGPPTSS